MTDKVSVVIPVYNVAPYVECCVRSVMNQSYENLEIILIDDDSTDGSLEICEALANEDKRIIHLKNRHQGVVLTRNTGIKKATGKYVIFVDADDWIDRECVTTMVTEIGDCDAVLADCIEEIADETNEDNNQKIYVGNELRPGIYCGDKIKELWNSTLWGSEKFFISNIWKYMFLTSKIKEVYKLVDKRIWWGEDTTMSRAFLFQANKVKVLKYAAYHKRARNNEGQDRRYVRDSYGALANADCFFWGMRKIVEGNPNEKLLKSCVNRDLKYRINESISWYVDSQCFFYYPYHGRLIGKKVVLYGAGNVGKSFRESILTAGESHLVLWVDKVPRKEYGVSEISEILDVTYDYIVVAIFDEKVYEQIKVNLMEMGISEEKILWNRTREEIM